VQCGVSAGIQDHIADADLPADAASIVAVAVRARTILPPVTRSLPSMM
jgi:hypothetical protein